MRHRRSTVLLFAAMLACATLAQAQPSDPAKLAAAAEEFDEGTKLFKRKEFEEAAAHFEAADRYAPSPAALANAIRARKSAKQNARAATLAIQGAARYPDDKPLADVAKDALKNADKQLHKVDITCDPACTLVADGKVASAEAVTSFTLFLDPGSHSVVAGWSGDRSKSSSVTAQKGGSDTLSLKAPAEEVKAPPPPPPTVSASAEPPPPPPKPHEPGVLPRWTVYAGAGLTVVLAGVAIWSGLDTKKNPGPDAVKAACVGLGDSCPQYQDGLSRQHRTNGLWIATAGVGVLTGVAAAFLVDWSSEPDAPKEAAKLRVRPTGDLSPSGVSLGARGVF